MVKIRLRRVGAKKQPSYRVVVADSRSPRDGRFIEVIGYHNPRTEPETVTIKEDRALHWLRVGAQPTDAVQRLLRNQGTLDRFERLKQGESLDTLVVEAAEAAQAASEVSPKTRLESVVAEAEPTGEAEEESSEAEPTGEAEEESSEAEPTGEAEEESSEAEPTGEAEEESSEAVEEEMEIAGPEEESEEAEPEEIEEE